MAFSLTPAQKIAPGLLAGMAVCAPVSAEPVVSYLGVETRLLEGDLVTFRVALRGAPTEDAVVAYAECAAARYALIRGYGFARHIRTELGKRNGIWRADAAWLIAKGKPSGPVPVDAMAAVADCTAKGIPTV